MNNPYLRGRYNETLVEECRELMGIPAQHRQSESSLLRTPEFMTTTEGSEHSPSQQEHIRDEEEGCASTIPAPQQLTDEMIERAERLLQQKFLVTSPSKQKGKVEALQLPEMSGKPNPYDEVYESFHSELAKAARETPEMYAAIGHPHGREEEAYTKAGVGLLHIDPDRVAEGWEHAALNPGPSVALPHHQYPTVAAGEVDHRFQEEQSHKQQAFHQQQQHGLARQQQQQQQEMARQQRGEMKLLANQPNDEQFVAESSAVVPTPQLLPDRGAYDDISETLQPYERLEAAEHAQPKKGPPRGYEDDSDERSREDYEYDAAVGYCCFPTGTEGLISHTVLKPSTLTEESFATKSLKPAETLEPPATTSEAPTATEPLATTIEAAAAIDDSAASVPSTTSTERERAKNSPQVSKMIQDTILAMKSAQELLEVAAPAGTAGESVSPSARSREGNSPTKGPAVEIPLEVLEPPVAVAAIVADSPKSAAVSGRKTKHPRDTAAMVTTTKGVDRGPAQQRFGSRIESIELPLPDFANVRTATAAAGKSYAGLVSTQTKPSTATAPSSASSLPAAQLALTTISRATADGGSAAKSTEYQQRVILLPPTGSKIPSPSQQKKNIVVTSKTALGRAVAASSCRSRHLGAKTRIPCANTRDESAAPLVVVVERADGGETSNCETPLVPEYNSSFARGSSLGRSSSLTSSDATSSDVDDDISSESTPTPGEVSLSSDDGEEEARPKKHHRGTRSGKRIGTTGTGNSGGTAAPLFQPVEIKAVARTEHHHHQQQLSPAGRVALPTDLMMATQPISSPHGTPSRVAGGAEQERTPTGQQTTHAGAQDVPVPLPREDEHRFPDTAKALQYDFPQTSPSRLAVRGGPVPLQMRSASGQPPAVKIPSPSRETTSPSRLPPKSPRSPRVPDSLVLAARNIEHTVYTPTPTATSGGQSVEGTSRRAVPQPKGSSPSPTKREPSPTGSGSGSGRRIPRYLQPTESWSSKGVAVRRSHYDPTEDENVHHHPVSGDAIEPTATSQGGTDSSQSPEHGQTDATSVSPVGLHAANMSVPTYKMDVDTFNRHAGALLHRQHHQQQQPPPVALVPSSALRHNVPVVGVDQLARTVQP